MKVHSIVGKVVLALLFLCTKITVRAASASHKERDDHDTANYASTMQDSHRLSVFVTRDRTLVTKNMKKKKKSMTKMKAKMDSKMATWNGDNSMAMIMPKFKTMSSNKVYHPTVKVVMTTNGRPRVVKTNAFHMGVRTGGNPRVRMYKKPTYVYKTSMRSKKSSPAKSSSCSSMTKTTKIMQVKMAKGISFSSMRGGKGKGRMRPRPPLPSPPTATPPETIFVDFTPATPDEPVRLFNVNPPGNEIEVEVSVPTIGDDTELFTVETDVEIGSSCPPTNGQLVPINVETITIPINGVDTVIVLCTGGVVVAKCLHVFVEAEEYNNAVGQIPSGTTIVDFFGASSSSPITSTVFYGPGVGSSTFASFLFSGIQSGGGFYFRTGGSSQTFQTGDPCPPVDAIILDPIEGFDLTLFVASEEDETIYACDGVIVGICDIEYVPSPGEPTSAPSLPPTSEPTASLAPSTSHAPSVSFAPSLSLETQNQLVTCIAVIDETAGFPPRSTLESLWTQLRAEFPKRPFCLLQPYRGDALVVYAPPALLSDPATIFVNVTRDENNASLASDWYEICDIETSKKNGLSRVALFVDNSGSMTTSTVQASFDLFLQRLAENNLVDIEGVYNNNQDYISPCLTTSVLTA
eukprot:scaffold6061_cov156-Amphora_coffeaeformis.AAC.8